MSPRSAGRFLLDSFAPAYLRPEVRATLPARVAAARKELEHCHACPRHCGVNRLADERGVCRSGRHAQVSSAFAHFGEEACLTGRRGSGTIFFSLCNLRCVFCQNWDISQQPGGEHVQSPQLADLMLALQEQGCHNINLVTPEHVVPQVVDALVVAIDAGLHLPVVYNTSGYDALSSLRLMDGLVDIYMPDFKFWTPASAARYSKAADYPERARDALREMHRQVGDLSFTPDGIACRGLLVRHLVMPGLPAESEAIFRFLADEVSPDTFVNIMGQYRPAYQVGCRSEVSDDDTGSGALRYEELDRRPTAAELEAAFESARAAGLWRFDDR
ncbi:MAG TPA: radical SAM protein [Phycisphaerae bacterium]|nr:radical SAM protein [Phycisphaerae bacterium]HNU44114.1 radical SAM protein [Phycisphaerae bacterium]